jgi:hypothetical protein
MTDEMKQMQEQLNKEVLSKPFSVADEAKVKAYIEGAQRRGEVPLPYTGKHWRPGYTCYDLRPYSYREYLACRYYHAYYGRYYPIRVYLSCHLWTMLTAFISRHGLALPASQLS